MAIKGLRRLATLIGLALLAAALIQELRKRPEDRRWHGKVAGAVPYDFRPPTWQRVKTTYWNPDDADVVKDKVFGVGWDVNFGAVARKVGVA